MTTIPVVPPRPDLGAPLADPLSESTRRQTSDATSNEADWTALADAHTRTIDAEAGYRTMVDKAEPSFRPVAQRFLDLHARHGEHLARLLLDAGQAPDADGSFMSTVNRAVVSMRALFDEIDGDVMDNIRSGEDHVRKAYDRALSASLPAPVRDAVARMVRELDELLTETARID